MRPLLMLAAAMLQSTHALNPLMQRCCAESLAGCAGGLAKQLAVYPLDRAATRLETKKGAKATNVQQAYRGAGVLMLFALPYAVAFHVPFVLVETALPVGDAAARASLAGFLAALAHRPTAGNEHDHKWLSSGRSPFRGRFRAYVEVFGCRANA